MINPVTGPAKLAREVAIEDNPNDLNNGVAKANSQEKANYCDC